MGVACQAAGAVGGCGGGLRRGLQRGLERMEEAARQQRGAGAGRRQGVLETGGWGQGGGGRIWDSLGD